MMKNNENDENEFLSDHFVRLCPTNFVRQFVRFCLFRPLFQPGVFGLTVWVLFWGRRFKLEQRFSQKGKSGAGQGDGGETAVAGADGPTRYRTEEIRYLFELVDEDGGGAHSLHFIPKIPWIYT